MEFNSETLMKTAIEEMKNGQHSEASRHFDMVVVSDASNIDAPFFRAYCNCYDIKLGEMPNAAIGFTNAFIRYVDAVKALNNPVVEREKLDYAITLLNELVSMYQVNSKRTTWTAPSVGLSISNAASTMNTNCRNKLQTSRANISSSVMSQNDTLNKSSQSLNSGFVVLMAVGAIAFVLWMLWGVVF